MRARWLLISVVGLVACGGRPAATPSPAPPRPSVLLVTLDTTRADAVGPEAVGVRTPAFDALAARGLRFRRAYTTVPETLPAHASLLTGLLPAGHGVHENGRTLAAAHPVLAERLQAAGYRTAAFVSAFVLARRFGLARGFDHYDDTLPAGGVERGARATTDAALAFLQRADPKPLLLWVHYFDAHAPYTPPEPWRTAHRDHPYRGEVAAVDAELGRLVAEFERRTAGPHAVVVAGDHGEGLGDHGEPQHGHLLYDATMRVPLALVGPGVAGGVSDAPVSTRRVFHTIAAWAGVDNAPDLRTAPAEVVAGEAMKPFLSYGWQPQVMAVDARHKVIQAGRREVYDPGADPGETRDLGDAAPLSREVRNALADYPLPSASAPPAALDADAQRQLAALGYVASGARPVVRRDAPRPADMTALFGLLERASGLFVAQDYARVVPLLEQVLVKDPHNLDAILRLATAQSALGRASAADAAFARAAQLAPGSGDVRLYHALHLARGARWAEAVPALEQAVREAPDRLAAVEALAALREKQGRFGEAAELLEQAHRLRPATGAELVRRGRLAMDAGRTDVAVRAFEAARAAQGASFRHDLELGVLLLASRRTAEARDALDRVLAAQPREPMALFKRAQASVLLDEPDAAVRIGLARRHADASTRELVARERLFAGR